MTNIIEVVIRAKDETGDVLSGFGSALGGIGSIATGVLTAGIGVAIGGFAALGGEIAVATKAAMDAQEVQSQLQSVLRSTGGVAGVTAEAANDLALNLSKVTRFEDDAILSGENLLLTFTNIGKDVFPQATETVLDLSQALGQDLKASSIQVGKALNDPLTGLTALSRVGVSFTEEQKNTIKALLGDNEQLQDLAKNASRAQEALPKLQNDLQVAQQRLREMAESGKASSSSLMAQNNRIAELQTSLGQAQNALNEYSVAQAQAANSEDYSTRLAEAQQIILGELQREFGGAAEAAGKTFAGQLDILRNRLGEVQEEIGGAVLPILQTLLDSVLMPMVPTVEMLGSSFALLIEALAKGEDPIGAVASTLADVSRALGFSEEQTSALFNAVASLREPFEELFNLLTAGDIAGALQMIFPPEIADAIMNVFNSVANLGSAFQEQMPAMRKVGEDFMAWVVPALKDALPQILNNIATILNTLAEFWREWGDEIMAVVSVVMKTIGAIIGAEATMFTGVLAAALQLMTGDVQGAMNTISSSIQTSIGLATSAGGQDLDQFVATWRGNWDLLQTIVSAATMRMTSGIQDFTIRTGRFILALPDTAANAMRQFASSISMGISNAASAAGSYAQDLVRRIGNALAEIPNRALEAGRRVISGILTGIQEGISRLVQAMTDLASRMIGAFTGTMGIHSDSSVMKSFGRNVTGGLATGISESALRPSFAMASVAPSIVNAAAGATSVTNNNTNSSPSFTFIVSERVGLDQVEAMVRRVLG